ncbi:MAG: hypothetical protein NT018_00725 [Armatimonadetes bacterium]|nr:hypothetical protein [Armatimonadota bacterium]
MPKYIVDSKGRRTAVVLPVKVFEAMVRELEDLTDAQYVDNAEASAEGFVGLSALQQHKIQKRLANQIESKG